MRRAIETVPRDGKVVILEDDTSGTYDLAHWSAQARAWVRENGEPSKITPTYWHAMRRDKYLLQEQFVSSGPSRARRFFPFSSGRAAPQRPPAASELIAPRPVAKPAPVTVAAFEAQTVPGRAKRSPHAWRRFAVSSIAAAMVAASLIGMYFRAEVAAYVTRYAVQQDILRIGTIGGQVVEQETQFPSQDTQKADSFSRDAALQQQAEADRGSSQAAAAAAGEAAQVKQVAEALTPEVRQSLEKERRRADALANELAETRRSIEGRNLQLRAAAAKAAQSLEREREKTAALVQDVAAARQELMASAVQYRQALAEERDRADALASELTVARRDVETQLAVSSKTRDEAAQLKQAAESATAELRQSLQQEHDRAEAMASKLARARPDVETQTALSRKAGDEAVQFKQTVESTMAELRQSLQRERGRAEALARDLESARRTIDGRVALERTANSQIVQVTQAAEVAATKQPAAAEEQSSPEATRLIARASALLGQGNIGAARTVLQRAAETGSALASFMLAETYDPAILSAWGTYGTRGEATKARELYAKAYDGGIQEAKDRFNALRQ
jgi:hypothetical protein